MRVLIDGHELSADEAAISVFDWGLVRGFGCFEVIRSYGGVPFRVQEHVERMERSAAALGLEMPEPGLVSEWVEKIAAAGGDCLVRCYLTAGSRDTLFPSSPRLVVLWEELPQHPDQLRLLPVKAPWHAAGDFSELTQAKTLSYAPNMAAAAVAEAAGFDDALLIGRDGSILEGPTFSVCWFRDGELYTPGLELGILESITRRLVIGVAEALGTAIHEGRYRLDELTEQDEVLALSTVKEVAPVSAVGAMKFTAGGQSKDLATAVADVVADEVSS